MARRIFRESALQRYNERLEKIELPRYASAPWTLLIWLGALLLLLTTALLLAVRLPEYAVGTGVVVAGANTGESGAAVVAFLPAEYAASLAPGQTVELDLPPGASGEAEPLRAVVRAVEPDVLSPAAARAAYRLDSSTGSLINGPVIIALIDANLPAGEWLGSVGEARIAINTRSVLSLLPGLVAGETGVGVGE